MSRKEKNSFINKNKIIKIEEINLVSSSFNSFESMSGWGYFYYYSILLIKKENEEK